MVNQPWNWSTISILSRFIPNGIGAHCGGPLTVPAPHPSVRFAEWLTNCRATFTYAGMVEPFDRGLGPPALARLRQRLQADRLASDGRIPAERILAQELDLSRAELRKALAVLEAEGRLLRHVGRGTFLRTAAPSGGPGPDEAGSGLPNAALAEVTSPRDVVQARLVVEPELARLAALNATARQIDRLRMHERELRAADTWQAYDTLDAAYHRLIAEAAGNDLLLAMHEIVDGVRRNMAWGRLLERGEAPGPDHGSHAEHAAITQAIAARDRHGAASALHHHLMVEAASLGPQMS